MVRFGPVDVVALSPVWSFEFVGLNADETGTDGGLDLEDEEFMAERIKMPTEEKTANPDNVAGHFDIIFEPYFTRLGSTRK